MHSKTTYPLFALTLLLGAPASLLHASGETTPPPTTTTEGSQETQATPAPDQEEAPRLVAQEIPALLTTLFHGVMSKGGKRTIHQQDNYLPRKRAQDNRFLRSPSMLAYYFPSLAQGGWKLRLTRFAIWLLPNLLLWYTLGNDATDYLIICIVWSVAALLFTLAVGIVLSYKTSSYKATQVVHRLYAGKEYLSGKPFEEDNTYTFFVQSEGSTYNLKLLAAYYDPAQGILQCSLTPYRDPLARWEEEREDPSKREDIYDAKMICTLHLHQTDPAQPNLTIVWQAENATLALPAPMAFRLAPAPLLQDVTAVGLQAYSLVVHGDPDQSYYIQVPITTVAEAETSLAKFLQVFVAPQDCLYEVSLPATEVEDTPQVTQEQEQEGTPNQAA